MAKPKSKPESKPIKADAQKQYTSSSVYFNKDGVRFRPGQAFTLPAGTRPGKSMTEVNGDNEQEAEAPAPETMSELAKAEHDAQGDTALV